MLGRVSTRSFDSATGSVIANVTPDRSHASRVNASASNPGGSPPGACTWRRVCIGGGFVVAGVLLDGMSVMVSIPDSCALQTTTSSGPLAFVVLYVDVWFDSGNAGASELGLQSERGRGCRFGTPGQSRDHAAPDAGSPRGQFSPGHTVGPKWHHRSTLHSVVRFTSFRAFPWSHGAADLAAPCRAASDRNPGDGLIEWRWQGATIAGTVAQPHDRRGN